MAVANESSEQRASAPPTSIVTKPAGAHPNGNVPKLSEEAQGFLDEANGDSDAASSAWLAFLALLTYLLVTLASVSHKDLLLNSAVQLPIVVNVHIPLVGFFQYAPALLLLVYLSLLIQHVILARKYGKFTEAIASYERDTRTEHPARERVHSYVGSQILAGPKPNRVTNFLMRLIVYVTFTILPVITLLYFQIKFLPYHEVWITYWHRIAVILGILMLFLVTPQHSLWARGWEAFLGALVILLIIGFSWLIATVPNEWMDRRLGFVPPTSVRDGEEAKLLNPLVRFVYERIPGDHKGWLRGLLSYRVLVVEDSDLAPGEGVSVVLRERNLQFALLSRSDLHRGDLTWADLRGAQMWRTRMDKGKLNDTKLHGAFLREAQLQGANLSSAQLQGADLSNAQLQGADLSYAQLQGVDLKDAQLQGADLASAEVWLVNFPPGLTNQSPIPLGLADLELSPPTAEAKAELRQKLQANITDDKLLERLLDRLKPILQDDPAKWEDEDSWSRYVSQAKEPSPDEIVQFLAAMACDDTEDTEGFIADRMARRVEDGKRPYAKPFAKALLNENCKGAKALTDETRATLERIAR
ncbi:MAG: pentapeptide repeat-containing protein [Methyloceanibacter sp.]